MKTVEELKAEQAAALAKLEKEHALAQLAPVPPLSVQITSASLGHWLTYEAPDLFAAVEIMRNFAPLPFEQFKSTFTRFVPEALNVGRYAGERVNGPFVAKIDVTQGEGFGPTVTFKFFAKLGADIAEIHVRLRHGMGADQWAQYGASFQAHNGGRDERLESRRYIVGTYRQNSTLGGMADNVIRWASGDGRSAHYQYSIMADAVNADGTADWNDAGLRLENIANTMHGEKSA